MNMISEYVSSVVQGLIQGLTEFLPVSSSAHLTIFQHLTGSQSGLAYDLVLHLATLAATVLFFGRDIVGLLVDFFASFRLPVGQKREGWYFGWAVIFGSLPTAAIGLALEPFVERAGQSLTFTGCALLVTCALLLLLSKVVPGRRKICVSIGLIVGVAQGLAVFPGISRSGATLTAAILCGLSAAEAFRFSFLLSLPAIAGAALLELPSYDGVLPAGWAAGAAVAFLSGFAALLLLRKTVVRGRWRIFAVYCGALGLCAILGLPR